MKYSNYIGVAAAILLIIACFMSWAYYPDINKTFTGFFSEKNIYGKPGKFLAFFACISIIFFLIPKVWAKRANLLIAAILVAFSIKSYLLFSNCYQGICPEKKIGIYLMLIAPFLIVLSSLLPSGKTGK
jgi:hypothetical protein